MRCALLHGFAGDPSAWDGVIGAESIAVALPGHGGGPVLATWDANLATIAAAIDCDVVIGYSLGARIALGLVAAGFVARAVLVSVNPGLDDAERTARRASDAAWARLLRERGIAAFADAWQAQSLFASQARVPPDRLAARRARRLALDPGELARSLEVMGLAEMPDYRAAMAGARVALITGADDAKFTAIARTMSLPHEAIAGCGHDPTLERPVELAAAIARAIAAT